MSRRTAEAVHLTWIDVLSNPVQMDIVRGLVELGDATAAELAEHTYNSTTGLRRQLRLLVNKGAVRQLPGNEAALRPGRRAVRYALYADVHAAATVVLAILERPLDSDPLHRQAPPSRR